MLVDTSGHTQELLPAVDQDVATTLSTTSATPAAISGSPTVTVNIGNGGDCEITAGAFIGSATNNSSTAYLVIDGTNEGSIFGLGSGSSVAGTSRAQGESRRGCPRFIRYPLARAPSRCCLNQDGTAAPFSANYLKVQPV